MDCFIYVLESCLLICFFFSEAEAETQNDTQSGEQSPATSEAQLALQQFWPKVMDDIKKYGTVCNVNNNYSLLRTVLKRY